MQPYQQQYGFALEVVDVDADAALEEKYNELVPGATLGRQGNLPLVFDEALLRAFLAEKFGNCLKVKWNARKSDTKSMLYNGVGWVDEPNVSDGLGLVRVLQPNLPWCHFFYIPLKRRRNADR